MATVTNSTETRTAYNAAVDALEDIVNAIPGNITATATTSYSDGAAVPEIHKNASIALDTLRSVAPLVARCPAA
jgi:hypothetical protein